MFAPTSASGYLNSCAIKVECSHPVATAPGSLRVPTFLDRYSLCKAHSESNQQIVPCGCTIGSESAKTIHWVSSFGTKSFTGDPRTTNSTAYNLQSVCQNSDDCQFLVRVISCEFRGSGVAPRKAIHEITRNNTNEVSRPSSSSDMGADGVNTPAVVESGILQHRRFREMEPQHW